MKTRASSAPVNEENNTSTVKNSVESRLSSRKAVVSYTILLAVVLIALIVLSYFIDQRNDSRLDTLSQENITALKRIETLQDTTVSLESENKDLKAQITELEGEIEAANSTIDEKNTEIDDLNKKYDDLKKEYDDYKKTVAETMIPKETGGETND